jgi:hypothetical protein
MAKTKNQEINLEIEKEFEKKFISEEKFAEEIEHFYKTNNCSNYLTAIADYCDFNNIDIEAVPKLISKQFKKKIEHQVAKLNFLKVKPLTELPI